MKVTFWGCRGSIPASYKSADMRYKIKYALEHALTTNLSDQSEIDTFIDKLPFDVRGSYGNNTPCVQISGGEEVIICDAGSGIRDLGNLLVRQGPKMPKVINILISHLHWDHIQGFPFFIPAYIQGTTINIWGCHHTIEKTFIDQQEPPTFPVRLRDMGSVINFHTMDVAKKYNIGGIDISLYEQPHPGTSYGFRFEKDDKVAVYSTDAEHTDDSQKENYPFLNFIRDADLLIFDGQFSLADHLFTKQNWGHSSNLVGIELSVRANVKKLCLFHSDHTFNDQELQNFLKNSHRYLEIYDEKAQLDISISYDGLEIEL